MNFHNDNFNSNNNSLSLSFTGKGLRDTSNSLNNYLKTGIRFIINKIKRKVMIR